MFKRKARSAANPPASPPRKKRWPRIKRLLKYGALLSILGSAAFTLWLLTPPAKKPGVTRLSVNDVTQLNPIAVTRVFRPRSIEEIQTLLRDEPGPVSIGGGRYSMGGQTACPGCVQIDMRGLDKVLELDAKKKRVRVQAGITWHKLQDAIDPQGLAVTIMQTYRNFTVGGALSVNAHGRYVGEGPVVRSVEEIELVLADGSLVRASPTENSELFYGAIGGYGGIGVIATATLRLSENVRIQRHSQRMDLSDYGSYFQKNVRNDKAAIFHNADLYAPDYDTVNAQTWAATKEPLTIEDRFTHSEAPDALGRALLYWVTELPLGHFIRRNVYDRWVFRDEPVVWRNHEASYDVVELEPPSRKDETYVLQEYFVPVKQLTAFVPKLRKVLNDYDVKVVNVSIRHALPDPGTLLAWAPEEVFSFVLYYKQGTSAEARAHVGKWTRAAIDAVLSVGGRYYLPYQPHATRKQLEAAYPRFVDYLALKRRVDPTLRFRNTLLDTYLPPVDDASQARRALRKDVAVLRAEGQTFLTLPEWYIVFSAEEYQRHLATRAPSDFPFFASNGQLWNLYRGVIARTREEYPPNFEYHVMNVVIGVSYSVENIIKGLYEGTVGRVTEWLACPGAYENCNAEDAFAAQVAREYDTLIRTYPWYEFPFGDRLSTLWSLDSGNNPSWTRTIERRLYLSAEYGIKALYAAAIRSASQSAFGVEELTTRTWLTPGNAQLPDSVKVKARFGNELVADLPRYEGFRDTARTLTQGGASFREIAGNDHIALSVVAPRNFKVLKSDGEVTARWPVLTDSKHERILLFMPVIALGANLTSLEQRGAQLDHIFDY